NVSRTSEAGHECRRSEVPAVPAASSFQELQIQSGTRIICLLVPLCFRSSCQTVPRCITNFGNGALARARPELALVGSPCLRGSPAVPAGARPHTRCDPSMVPPPRLHRGGDRNSPEIARQRDASACLRDAAHGPGWRPFPGLPAYLAGICLQ